MLFKVNINQKISLMQNIQIIPIFNKILSESSPEFSEGFYKILKNEQSKNSNQPWLKDLILLTDTINAENKSK
jgi:hypothetical protein